MTAWSVSFLVILSLQDVLSCQPEVGRSKRNTGMQQNMMTDLHRDLMEGYDADVIPMLGPSTGVDTTNALLLNFGVSLISLDMERKKKLLSTTAWLKMSWMDFRLKWDPDMYGGIQNVRFPASKLWMPDFEVYNSADYTSKSIKEKLSSALCIIYSTGFVLFIPPLSFQTYCTDSETNSFFCSIKFGSWTYDGFHIDLKGFNNMTSLILDNLSRNSPYLVTSQEGDALHSKYYPCCEEPYPSMVYNMTVSKAEDVPANVEDYFAKYSEGLMLTGEELVRMRGY